MLDEDAKMIDKFKFCEFFAGGGMARAGLGSGWKCLLANDMDRIKASTYIRNWGGDHFDSRDVREIKTTDIKDFFDLAWASFPCQDLSVAGNGLGIGVSETSELTRSGAIWPFLDLMDALRQEGREPPLIVLENVVGLLTLEQGRDFSAICIRLAEIGYRYGAIIVDARHFLPQSRPRVFVVAVQRNIYIPERLSSGVATASWHTQILLRAYNSLPPKSHEDWIWWDLGIPPELNDNALERIIQLEGAEWDSPSQTSKILNMMAPIHLARLEQVKSSKNVTIGSLYLRMRREGGINKQRAEITFSPVLGCLRTPRGGASRPRIIAAGEGKVRTRLLSTYEAAELMGLENTYILPEVYQHAFKIIGDGVAVPVVRFLAKRLLEPLAMAARRESVIRNVKACIA